MCFRICSIAGAQALLRKMQGLMRRSCAHPSSVTMSYPRHLMVCLPGETCENKDRFDTLSIPICVIKKGPAHGARHGNSEEQRIHHMAYNTYKRCRKKKKRWYIGSLSEQSKVQSITSGTWVDRRVVCKTRRTCAGGPFIHVNSQRTPKPRINLDSSSQHFVQNGPMSERPDFEEAVRTIIIVCFKSQVKRMGEFIPVSRDDNEVTTHFGRQVKEVHVLIARRDGSGIRILSHGQLLNFGGHCPAGTNSLIIFKKGCRISLPGNSDSL